MERNISLYMKNQLFRGIPVSELVPLLACLMAEERSYARGEKLFSCGDRAEQLGIVLSGRINAVFEDILGGKNIISTAEEGDLFCDAFACSAERLLPVSIYAQTDCTVLLIEAERILHTCEMVCPRHRLLSENLVHILADKYIDLSRKIINLSYRTTRRKLLSYLKTRSQTCGDPFSIPYNRQELADFLFVDRTGLSAEWNRLVKEGVLKYKNGLCSLSEGAGDDEMP